MAQMTPEDSSPDEAKQQEISSGDDKVCFIVYLIVEIKNEF